MFLTGDNIAVASAHLIEDFYSFADDGLNAHRRKTSRVPPSKPSLVSPALWLCEDKDEAGGRDFDTANRPATSGSRGKNGLHPRNMKSAPIKREATKDDA